MTDIQGVLNQAKTAGRKKLVGERSLTLGELIATILGILLIVFGTKIGLKKAYCLPLGVGLIFFGELAF